jgi:HPr kinase/phosphorylase
MQFHGSCAARDGAGVLLLGPAGAGKSDLTLRLLDRGFQLVADDRVDVADGVASAPTLLAGLLEIRGLGLLRFSYLPAVRLRLVAQLGGGPDRLPLPALFTPLSLPQISLDAMLASAAYRVALALDLAQGIQTQPVGAFAP